MSYDTHTSARIARIRADRLAHRNAIADDARDAMLTRERIAANRRAIRSSIARRNARA